MYSFLNQSYVVSVTRNSQFTNTEEVIVGNVKIKLRSDVTMRKEELINDIIVIWEQEGQSSLKQSKRFKV
jgi:hypothetical protein